MSIEPTNLKRVDHDKQIDPIIVRLAWMRRPAEFGRCSCTLSGEMTSIEMKDAKPCP